jgi:hypothetical protein
VGAGIASDTVAPNVIVHSGLETSVFDAAKVEVNLDEGSHRLTTPLGYLDLPVPTPGVLALPGQTWLLNNHVWVEVISADEGLVEFALIDPP